MFERFTDRARAAVVFAQQEARDLRHGYIGTEHILLGILREDESVGWKALDRLGVRLEGVRSDVVRIVGQGASGALADPDAEALKAIGVDLDEVRRRADERFGSGALERPTLPRRDRRRSRACGPIAGHIPFTPRAKKVMELALREAVALGHRYIGTEHILLGLVKEGEGLAASILTERHASMERIRSVVLELLSGRGSPPGRTA